MRTRAMALILMLGAVGCRAKVKGTDLAGAPMAGGREFVVEFYAWYHGDSTSSRNIDTLLAARRTWLAPELAAGIDSDNACAARTHGECLLEEDPILASQDPCQRYEVGGALAHGDTIGVSVFGVCDGKRDTLPAVIAMALPVDSGWQFVNFVYPAEHTDLSALLSRRALR